MNDKSEILIFQPSNSDSKHILIDGTFYKCWQSDDKSNPRTNTELLCMFLEPQDFYGRCLANCILSNYAWSIDYANLRLNVLIYPIEKNIVGQEQHKLVTTFETNKNTFYRKSINIYRALGTFLYAELISIVSDYVLMDHCPIRVVDSDYETYVMSKS